MNVLKGFCAVQALHSNQVGVVAPLGEISTWSLTYTKDKGEYQTPLVPGYRLVSARSYNTTTGDIPADPALAEHAIQVIQSAYNYAATHIQPLDLADLRDNLQAQYFSQTSTFEIGPIVNNGFIGLPQWISWTNETYDTYVKIWLSDEAFADQFDEYQITVIPPLENIDDFFILPGALKPLIESRTFTDMMELVQEAKQRNPETYIRSYSFDYVSSAGVTFPTAWTVLVYGMQGDNIDTIKDAISNYVLSHSQHSEAEWEAILPELFRRTEFVLLPRWDLYSIPDLVVQKGLYSSLINPKEALEFCQQQVTFYPANHITDNVTIMPYDYKALSMCVVGGYSNIVGKQKLTELFQDYIPEPSTSLDFNRMQPKTRAWVLLIEEMLLVAETMDAHSSVPKKFRKVHRDGLPYLSFVYDEVQYLMAPLYRYGVVNG